VDQDVRAVVDVDPLAISEELERLPGDLAYWGHQLAGALKASMRAKFAREQVAARLGIELRETAVKKLTVGDVEDRVIAHGDYERAKLEEIDREAERARLQSVIDALKAKRDALMQLAQLARAEMGADVQVRELHRGRRAQRTDG
jgi:hypothetical protein